MLTSDAADLDQNILIYFQNYLKMREQLLKYTIVDMNAKLVDLGFESIDYIDLATSIFEKTGQWVDISKIGNGTRISDLSSYLIKPDLEKPKHKIRVKLDDWQRYVYSKQLKDDRTIYVTYIVQYLCLKEGIDLSKLKLAIAKTLNNHFILNSRLIPMIDDYYFEKTPIQSDFTFKGSFLFPKRELAKLIVKVQSDRLVNIYLQTKNNHHYLIIAFHHIALDGWSSVVIQEEIFRRYARLHHAKARSVSEDICALSMTYSSSLNEQSNTDELRSLLKSVNSYEYNQLDHLFHGKLQASYFNFVLKKEHVDQYARSNSINDFSYSVIFTYMVHQIISLASGVEKLFIYTSLSNRHLPIAGIKALTTNIATGLPVFLSKGNMSKRQFAVKINETLKIYFKQMSYGAITRILLENNTLLNKLISPYMQPYWLMLTYINNPSKIIYGNDSITSHYVNWNKSRTHICIEDSKQIFFVIHNRGSEFLIELHSRVNKESHAAMIHNFFMALSSFP